MTAATAIGPPEPDDLDASVDVRLPAKMVDLMQGIYRYRVAYGGRGSGKTRGFALMTAIVGYQLGMQGVQGQIVQQAVGHQIDQLHFLQMRQQLLQQRFR